ncbi:uncharacterized protein TrAtP1_003193 [Trichoderma atroviride]|uniref:uncharacterized protein n=1 Tax=Hypocrea atroviridis TaxID=63577 RepID=UPI0033205771|nr:hypothetical protein TrAtP1_003193 [Trichoderma atroviride]
MDGLSIDGSPRAPVAERALAVYLQLLLRLSPSGIRSAAVHGGKLGLGGSLRTANRESSSHGE